MIVTIPGQDPLRAEPLLANVALMSLVLVLPRHVTVHVGLVDSLPANRAHRSLEPVLSGLFFVRYSSEVQWPKMSKNPTLGLNRALYLPSFPSKTKLQVEISKDALRYRVLGNIKAGKLKQQYKNKNKMPVN